MELLAFPLLAFAPGIFWLWFFVRRDKYRPEPKRVLAITFFWGMASTIPAALIEFVFLDESVLSDSADLGSVVVAMMFVVGPVEEISKFLAVALVAYRSLYFDEPSDGLVYSAAASLGFASLENLFYILEFGPAVMIGRAPLSTLAHLVFGSIWGYALGRRVHAGSSNFTPIATGIAVGAILHGLFNVAVHAFWPVAIGLTVLGAWWTVRRFDWAQSVSPFRYRRNYPRVRCDNCGRLINVISRYCSFCGIPHGVRNQSMYCGNCGNINRPDASYCVDCGDGLLR